MSRFWSLGSALGALVVTAGCANTVSTGRVQEQSEAVDAGGDLPAIDLDPAGFTWLADAPPGRGAHGEDAGLPTRAPGGLPSGASDFAYDRDTVVWVADDTLYAQALPAGPVTAVGDLGEMAVHSMDVDDGRAVLTDRADGRYIVFDLRDGSRRDYEPSVEGRLLRPSLDGDWLAYSLDQPPSSNHAWADEWEVYLIQLSTGNEFPVAPHRLTIQDAPILHGNTLVWQDDRHGHHKDGLPFHKYDLMLAKVDEVTADAGAFERLTMAPYFENYLAAFDGQTLIYYHYIAKEFFEYFAFDLEQRTSAAVDVSPGDDVLSLHGRWLAVQHQGLSPERCQLLLLDWRAGERYEVTPPGACPTRAALDDQFVVWHLERRVSERNRVGEVGHRALAEVIGDAAHSD